MTPSWARWRASEPFTVGVEEELMLLDPADWSLAQEIDAVLPALPPDLASHLTAETHGAVIELTSDPHATVPAAVGGLAGVRARLHDWLGDRGLRAAAAGTHPSTVW